MICCDRRIRSPPNDFAPPGPCLLANVEADRRRLDDGAGETKPQFKLVWFNMYVDHFELVNTSENVYFTTCNSNDRFVERVMSTHARLIYESKLEESVHPFAKSLVYFDKTTLATQN